MGEKKKKKILWGRKTLQALQRVEQSWPTWLSTARDPSCVTSRSTQALISRAAALGWGFCTALAAGTRTAPGQLWEYGVGVGAGASSALPCSLCSCSTPAARGCLQMEKPRLQRGEMRQPRVMECPCQMRWVLGGKPTLKTFYIIQMKPKYFSPFVMLDKAHP